jgi:DNA-binding MarR family transcriptional regulator
VDERRPTGAAFLLTQLGTHAARRFADRVSAADLTPPQAGLIRAVAGEPGRSQQALAAQLGTPVHITEAGQELLAELGRLAAEHEADLLAPLDPQERRTLAELLGRVAAAEGLTPGVHPGYRDLPADDRGPRGAPPCGT